MLSEAKQKATSGFSFSRLSAARQTFFAVFSFDLFWHLHLTGSCHRRPTLSWQSAANQQDTETVHHVNLKLGSVFNKNVLPVTQ